MEILKRRRENNAILPFCFQEQPGTAVYTGDRGAGDSVDR